MKKASLTLILFSVVMLAAVFGTAAFFDVPSEDNFGAKTEIVSESNKQVYAENFLEDLANRMDEGLVTKEEAMREYGAYNSRDVQFVTSTVSPSLSSAEASASAVKNETYVEGKLQWQYRLNPEDPSIVTPKDIAADTVTAPLRGVRVVLLDKDFLFATDPIAETYTDENGEYEFAFSNGHGIFERKDDIFIRIYAAGETFNIYGLKNYDIFHRLENVFNLKVFDFGLNHYIEKEVYKNVETGSMTRIDVVG